MSPEHDFCMDKRMQKYLALCGDAGVEAYEITEDGIILEFQDGSKYLYNGIKPGLEHVEAMAAFAASGQGLTTYVNQHVRGNYFKKLR